ncbi:MAG: hypothetical protein F6J86_03410 [Symploca sp. SIO1B1]|nr:hypothetical protein [Symploca sp. SIO1C2]NER92896.1 hypothetical protein [Symploca sp. SIO1B1]
MKDTDLREKLSAIARQFKVFECVLCAEALRQFLSSQSRSGWQISLFTGSTEDPFCNIYHENLQRNISVNGRHEAIAIMIEGQEVVFDNLHPEGLPRASWIENFYCPIQDLGGNFEITESKF